MLLGRSANVGTLWTVGVFFAIVDAITTYYALRYVGLHEGNPVAKWTIEALGLSQAVALRVLIGAVVLGIVAIGSFVHLRDHQRLVNRSCRWILVGSLVLWGVVAVSNTMQIAIVEIRY